MHEKKNFQVLSAIGINNTMSIVTVSLSYIKPLFFSLITGLFLFFPVSCGQKGSAHHYDEKQEFMQYDRSYTRTDSTRMQALQGYFDKLYRKGVLNGNVLVSVAGKVIFEASYGFANYREKRELTPETSFQLASVTKQFTAVSILMLKERGLLSLDDKVEKYIPDFPYQGITLRLLLCHRSGLPNYIYFTDHHVKDKEMPVSNSFVIALMNQVKPPVYYAPDRKFNYSNTGYIILASIVEKVSNKPFSVFLKQNIFEPLGMKNSFLSIVQPDSVPVAKGYKSGWREARPTFLDGVVGDKGLYSSVEDLLLWDQALYTNRILKQKTLQEALQPMGKPSVSRRNYGFGFRMVDLPDNTRVVYHTGWWEGFQTLLMRIPKDSTTVVVLKNRKSSHIDREAILNLLYPSAFPDKKAATIGKSQHLDDEESGE